MRSYVDLPQVVGEIPLGIPCDFEQDLTQIHGIKARTNHLCAIHTISNSVVWVVSETQPLASWQTLPRPPHWRLCGSPTGGCFLLYSAFSAQKFPSARNCDQFSVCASAIILFFCQSAKMILLLYYQIVQFHAKNLHMMHEWTVIKFHKTDAQIKLMFRLMIWEFSNHWQNHPKQCWFGQDNHWSDLNIKLQQMGGIFKLHPDCWVW